MLNRKAVPTSAKKRRRNRGRYQVKWGKVYSDLFAEIKVRHYSPMTLRSYSTWVRTFQAFTKSKKPSDLNPSDVKDFIRFLAVQIPGYAGAFVDGLLEKK